jgi:hypothetical protein
VRSNPASVQEEKMFKIDGFVEDKHVAKLMHAVAGLVMNFNCVPVVNAVKAGKQVKQEDPGTSKASIVANKVRNLSSGATVSAAQVKAFIIEVGGEVTSASYFMKSLVDNGVIKHIANRRGFYKVL